MEKTQSLRKQVEVRNEIGLLNRTKEKPKEQKRKKLKKHLQPLLRHQRLYWFKPYQFQPKKVQNFKNISIKLSWKLVNR
jgi:hypothetical protein